MHTFTNLIALALSLPVTKESFLSLLSTAQKELLPEKKIWELFETNKEVAKTLKQNNTQTLSSKASSLLPEHYLSQSGELIPNIAHKISLTLSAPPGLLSIAIHTENPTHCSQNISNLALDNILANLPGHVYWKDQSGTYLGCNDTQAQNLGFKSGSEIIGKTDFELPWPEASATMFRENDLAVMESGETLLTEEPSKMGGIDAIVLSHKIPLRNATGNIIGILGLSIDITKQKDAETQLTGAKEKAEAANRAKSAFIANMSHDIRTPITGMLGLAHSLKKTSETDSNKEDAAMLISVTNCNVSP